MARALWSETFTNTSTQKGLLYTSLNILSKEYCTATYFPPNGAVPPHEHAALLGLPAGNVICNMLQNSDYICRNQITFDAGGLRVVRAVVEWATALERSALGGWGGSLFGWEDGIAYSCRSGWDAKSRAAMPSTRS